MEAGMEKEKGMGGGGMHKDMEHRAPSSHDSSMTYPGGHVDDAATRSEESAKQPKSVGPRTA
jgi:hypothetical protein